MSKAFTSQYIPYSQTGKFTKIVVDYVRGANDLKEFYEHEVNIEGIKAAISQRKNYTTNRKLLVEQLESQYKNLNDSALVNAKYSGAFAGKHFYNLHCPSA